VSLSGVRVFSDPASLAVAAAELIIEGCNQALTAKGVCHLALSGGATPRAVYDLLAQPDYLRRLNWKQIQVFWGDERMVPYDHPESNFRMAWERLLSHTPLPSENIHRIRGELDLGSAAAAYDALLREVFGGSPLEVDGFDLLLLGMGVDGHVASLFPGSPALAEAERWAVAVAHDQPPPPLLPRVSLTLPAINAARQVLVMVAGEQKAGVLQRVLSGEIGGELLPAQLLKPRSGGLLWLADRAALPSSVGK